MGKKKKQSGSDNAEVPPPPPVKESKKDAAARKVPVEEDSSSAGTPPPDPRPDKDKDKSKEVESKLLTKKEKAEEEEKESKHKAKKRPNANVAEQGDKPQAAAAAAAAPPQQQQARDGRAIETAPQPAKAAARKSGWVIKDETLLAQQMVEDLKAGSDFHDKPKTDSYWEELCQSLKGKLSSDFTREQIYDKHRRMKVKFDKYESTKPSRKRSSAEGALHAAFKQLWGRDLPAEATAENSNGDVEMTPAKKGGEDRIADDVKAVIRPSDGGVDPVLTIAASLLHSAMANHKLGNEYIKSASRETRKRALEEQIAEYSSMRRRLKLAMDYCEVEEDVLAKKLSSI